MEEGNSTDDLHSNEVSQFMEIANISEKEALHYLAACSYDLNIALGLYLGQEPENTPPEMNSFSSSSHGLSSAGRNTGPLTGSAAVTRVHPSNPPLVWTFWSTFLFRLWTTVTHSLTFFASLIKNFFRSALEGPPRFPTYFVKKYGQYGPMFLSVSTLEEALNSARAKKTLLVVYVHSDLSQHTEEFCRKTLQNPSILEFLNDEERFVVWGSFDSMAVRSLLHPRGYPHISVLFPSRPSESVLTIGKLEGESSLDALLSLLVSAVDELENFKQQDAAVHQQRVEERTLRELQDEEYAEALRRDEEREIQRLAMETETRLHREEVEKKTQQREVEVGKIMTKRQNLAEIFRMEDEERKTNPLDSSKATRICLRLPTGQRLERQFCRQDSVQRLYEWAEASGYLSGSTLTIPLKFRLTTPLNSSLNSQDRDTSLENVGLVPNAVILLLPCEEDIDD